MMNKEELIEILDDRKYREEKWLKKMRAGHDVGIIPETLDATEEGLNSEYMFLCGKLEAMTTALEWRAFVTARKKEIRRLEKKYKDFKDDDDDMRYKYFVVDGQKCLIDAWGVIL